MTPTEKLAKELSKAFYDYVVPWDRLPASSRRRWQIVAAHVAERERKARVDLLEEIFKQAGKSRPTTNNNGEVTQMLIIDGRYFLEKKAELEGKDGRECH